MKYSVTYELEVQPSSVLVEIKCRDAVDQELVYNERLSNFNCKKLQKVESE
jgi:ribosomal protein S27E